MAIERTEWSEKSGYNPTMRWRLAAALLLAASFAAAQTPYRPGAAELRANYRRADEMPGKAFAAVTNLEIRVGWTPDGRHFVYGRDVPGFKRRYLTVEAATGAKKDAFSHPQFAGALKDAVGKAVDPDRMQLTGLVPSDDLKSLTFIFERVGYRADLVNYKVTKLERPPQQPERTRPDRAFDARIQDGQIQIRPRGTTDWKAITTDGDFARIAWFPSGNAFAAFRLLPGDRKPVYLLRSSVKDATRSVLEQRLYDQPGDKLDTYETYHVLPASEKVTKLALPAITGGGQPWSGPPNAQPWGDRLVLAYPIRGFQSHEIVELSEDGSHKVLIREDSKTFVDQGKTALDLLADGSRLIWQSERTGWSHFYLYDRRSGETKPITTGPWVARRIVSVDEAAGTLLFSANHIAAEGISNDDPYHLRLCRVNLDGTGFRVLTPGDGNSTWQLSPSRETFVSTTSRVDSPPVHELRRTSDGTLVAKLETCDAGGLVAAGASPVERFVAKGRDGTTDIHGIVVRPSHFDPMKTYPVIENIYAGPHDSHVPKTFRPLTGMHQLAELGFIVVQIDGMGTNNRGKAFHDVCHKNIADAGFPDRILWLKALAKRYPQADLKNVGIYGTSAGGQNSTGALLFHGDFYKVAVSSCGCHDNRIDKMWWNEQWMGPEIGSHYAEQSNITNAAKLKGQLMLILGEEDRNVPPESTYRLADALIKAGKEFEFVIIPGADHTSGGPYGERKRRDFFVRHLLGVTPPSWNES